ncbi:MULTISPECIES: hypothetical protein [Pseudomonas]|nr:MULTISPECIES: hypothetical protein [Pseudomonas]MBD8681487.1 hypothetical protein [Pseudomonas sp. CFBP 13719]
MPASDPFQRICDLFELQVEDLKVIMEHPATSDDDRLVALAMAQTIGLCLMAVGEAMETGDMTKVKAAMDEAELVGKKALEIVGQHSALKADKA